MATKPDNGTLPIITKPYGGVEVEERKKTMSRGLSAEEIDQAQCYSDYQSCWGAFTHTCRRALFRKRYCCPLQATTSQ